MNSGLRDSVEENTLALHNQGIMWGMVGSRILRLVGQNGTMQRIHAAHQCGEGGSVWGCVVPGMQGAKLAPWLAGASSVASSSPSSSK